MDEKLHNAITEAVKQGIVSSKQVESNMLGSFQATLKEHGALMESNGKSLEKLNEKVGFQNGRVTENEKQLTRIQTIWTAVSFLGPTIIIMAVWIFFNQIGNLKETIELTNGRINDLTENIRTRTIPSTIIK